MQSWAVAGYVYMFRLAAAGCVWAGLVVAVVGDLRTHPLLAGIVLFAAYLVALGAFLIHFVAALVGPRRDQDVLYGISITYLVIALRIAFTRRRRQRAGSDQTCVPPHGARQANVGGRGR